MTLGRIIGWVFFLAGLSVLLRDALVWLDTGHWAPLALGQLWYDFDRSSLNLVQAVVQRYLHPYVWNPVIVGLLLCWAFAVLIVLGALILLLSYRLARRRRTFHRTIERSRL
ncbi:MAG TPA: resistance to Congo red protein [Stellaceae bacterium]|jgi:hypothetical protein